jgi:hypothetical protein
MKINRLLLALGFISVSLNSYAAVTIAHVENSAVGGFMLSDKVTLPTTGEISMGFFSGTGPTATDWQNILAGSVANAWNSILALGYTDVRALSGATLGTGFDASFATTGSPTSAIGATVQNIPIASLSSGTRLYVLGFNAGSWDNTAKTATFGTATQFAVVSAWGHTTAAQNFASPADNGTKSMPFSASSLVSTDVLIGSLMTDTKYVAMIPEPAILNLLGLAALGILPLARRRSEKGKK